ncbi:isochorismatase family protein [Hirsutella rhossiliensis]|uniref:nicotinamidase n=1 Tax=Hirsutella rhossiliensis TaxID=111463 RepID=A0A9P8SNR7_9HYPO|nr:isochorismatase family domain-containing protein [Hirsutella rhossiliensis]KAH0968165.1 isochorismatase family domain-containing protein [Hirsutella rhossiliensis]
MQNDFCLPNGSLSVSGSLDIVPAINELLALNFTLKVLTRDWHPENHISFATNHQGQNISEIAIANPQNTSQTYTTPLWPKHCVQNTAGADFVSGLNINNANACVSKGQNPDTEMFSAFYDKFKVNDTGLLGLLTEARVTDVYAVGVAADFCVKETAFDASEKFTTYIVDDATKVIKMGDEEVQRVRDRPNDGVSTSEPSGPNCPE